MKNLLDYIPRNLIKKKFTCPICGYRGRFNDVHPATGLRMHAQCPGCKAVERHRIQYLVVDNILSSSGSPSLKMLHFAPEPFFREYFSKRFNKYETADLNRHDVEHVVDLTELPFEDRSYDFVFASHVLEHIPDDKKAISEIHRILMPNGIAILPVPIIAEKTIEYPEPNPNEWDHVRAPGMDYFERFNSYFSKVEIYGSDSLPGKYQPFIYEDRSKWPTEDYPLRVPSKRKRHIDFVPVCYI